MQRETVRVVVLCALVFVSAYLYWACLRMLAIFDPLWPRGLPYPDRLVEAWADWVLSFPRYQGKLMCGCTIRWIILSTLYSLLGASVLLTLVFGKPYLLGLITFKARPGECRCCRYDVTVSIAALSTHCPECGRPIDPVEVLRQRPDVAATCQRLATRTHNFACVHWIIWSVGLILHQYLDTPLFEFTQWMIKVFGFPAVQIYEQLSRMGHKHLLIVFLVLNSLLWGLGLSLLLEVARDLETRTQSYISRLGHKTDNA